MAEQIVAAAKAAFLGTQATGGVRTFSIRRHLNPFAPVEFRPVAFEYPSVPAKFPVYITLDGLEPLLLLEGEIVLPVGQPVG